MLKMNSAGAASLSSGITMPGGIAGTPRLSPSRDGVCDPGSDIQTSPVGRSASFALSAAASDVDAIMAVTKKAIRGVMRMQTSPNENAAQTRLLCAERPSAPPPRDQRPDALVHVVEGCLGQDLGQRHAACQGRVSGDHGCNDEGVEASGRSPANRLGNGPRVGLGGTD